MVLLVIKSANFFMLHSKGLTRKITSIVLNAFQSPSINPCPANPGYILPLQPV